MSWLYERLSGDTKRGHYKCVVGACSWERDGVSHMVARRHMESTHPHEWAHRLSRHSRRQEEEVDQSERNDTSKPSILIERRDNPGFLSYYYCTACKSYAGFKEKNAYDHRHRHHRGFKTKIVRPSSGTSGADASRRHRKRKRAWKSEVGACFETGIGDEWISVYRACNATCPLHSFAHFPCSHYPPARDSWVLPLPLPHLL